MEDLDRILDRDDVLAPRTVDVAEHRRERRRLPDTGRPGDEDETPVLFNEAPHALREPQRIEGRNVARDHPERERDVAALPEGVDAEPRQACRLVGAVELARLLERAEPRRGGAADVVEEALEPLRCERLPPVEGLERAVESDERRAPGLEMDIAGAQVDGGSQQAVQIHAESIGRISAVLER